MKKFLQNNNFGKWGWLMILYAAVSYYISAALSTDGLNFYPEQFGLAYGWNPGLITTLAGIAGWVALLGAIVFAQLIAKVGTRKSAGIINIITGALVLVFANTKSFALFIVMVFALNIITSNVQLNLVPNNIWGVHSIFRNDSKNMLEKLGFSIPFQ
jgi:MFS family permease